jgi:hypothetical protein
VQRQQALDDDELARLDQFGPDEPPRAVAVDGLENGLAHRKELKVLRHDLDVVTVWVQRGEWEPLALLPVVLVIVVHTNRRAALGPQRLDEPGRDGGLARRAVAGDGEHDRAFRRGLGRTCPLHPDQLVWHLIPVLVRGGQRQAPPRRTWAW